MSTVDYHFVTFEGFSPAPQLGPYRAADYWQLPEGAPVELIRGELVMSPSPRFGHQVVVAQLTAHFVAIATRSGGVAVCAPMDVIFSDDTILQPDVLYIAKGRRGIIGDWVNAPPDVVIEVFPKGLNEGIASQSSTLTSSLARRSFGSSTTKRRRSTFLCWRTAGINRRGCRKCR